jgi:putative ABC transport system substrate-binding protein
VAADVNLAAFRQGLKEAGYVDRQNVVIEEHWAEGHYDRLPSIVDELIGHHVAAIVTTGGLDTVPPTTARDPNRPIREADIAACRGPPPYRCKLLD